MVYVRPRFLAGDGCDGKRPQPHLFPKKIWETRRGLPKEHKAHTPKHSFSIVFEMSASWDLATLGTAGVAVVLALGIAGVLARKSSQPKPDPGPLPEPPAGSTFVTLPDSGIKIRYSDTGATIDEGVTYVLLHGFAGVLETWQFLAPLLPAEDPSCRVVSLDLAGSGFSDKPIGGDLDYSYRAQGRLVNEFLAALDLTEKVVLVGHSSGTVVAAAAAAMASDNIVVGTVFVANALFRSKPGLFSNPWLKPMFGWMAKKMTSDRKKSLARMHQPHHGERVLTDDFVGLFEAPTRLPGFQAALVETVVAKEAPYLELLDELLELKTPMLFVHGKDDAYKPLPVDQAEVLQEKLDALDPAARAKQLVRTESLADCAHYAQHEQPEALAGVLRSFVGEIDGI